VINPIAHPLLFRLEAQLTSDGRGMAQHLAAVIVAAATARGQQVPASVAVACQGITADDEHKRIAQMLGEGESRVILLGAIAQRHAAFSELRALAAALADLTGARLGYLPEGGNAVGASLAGVTPHRGVGGRQVAAPGLNATDMLRARLEAYLLVGGLEMADFAPVPGADASLQAAECVVALTPYASEEHKALASVILPVAAFAETSGTWVNVEGTWQSAPGAARPPGEARPAWKVLRVLGNLLGLQGFEYTSSEEVREELRRELGEYRAGGEQKTGFVPQRLTAVESVQDVGIYEVDAIVRRSLPLQQTHDGRMGLNGATESAA
jgi:NADH-quinone oxidoreductase subunit G